MIPAIGFQEFIIGMLTPLKKKKTFFFWWVLLCFIIRQPTLLLSHDTLNFMVAYEMLHPHPHLFLFFLGVCPHPLSHGGATRCLDAVS